MHCYQGGLAPGKESDVPNELHQHLTAWQAGEQHKEQWPSYKPLLQLLLSHGARVDLLYPGGYDMLEAASMAGAAGLLEVLLGVEPFRSMKEGTWSSSSSSSDSSFYSSSSQPDKQQSADAGTDEATPAAPTTTIDSSSSSRIANTTRRDSPVVNTPHINTGGTSDPRNDAPEVMCNTTSLNRCSQPLSWTVQLHDIPKLHILQLGWRPEVHPADVGKALLVSCKKVSLATCMCLFLH
jgi:hypothetical protein